MAEMGRYVFGVAKREGRDADGGHEIGNAIRDASAGAMDRLGVGMGRRDLM